MSFILDALKKSDAERQKRSTPGVADIPVSRDRRPRQHWLWVVGALLAVNLVALFVLLLRPDPPPTVADTAPVEPATAAPREPAAARPFAEIAAEARRKTEQAPAAATRREDRPEAVGGRAATTEPQPGARGATPGSAPVDAEEAADAANTFESLRADGTLSLPDMHLDVHVYSERREERFVFINTKKYRENETLAEGPIVTRIAPEGVILDYRGTVFLLPRE